MSAHAEAIRVSGPRAPFFAYWHLLSLDAPTVAVVWCCAFAGSAGVMLPVSVPLALGVATWMLYVADRLLDTQRANADANLRDRHWFHARHATAFLTGLASAALLLGWITLRDLPRDILRYELLLGAIVACYFAAIHLRLRLFHRLPAKEVVVGAIFAIAVAIPSWTSSPHSSGFAFPLVCFAALCALNCIAIEAVEGARISVVSLARCEILLLTLFAASLVAATSRWSSHALLLLAVALSALLLFILCRLRRRIHPLTFRVAADAALLTPILFAPWLLRIHS